MFITLLSVQFLISCTTQKSNLDDLNPKDFPPFELQLKQSNPGCKSMLDSYCNYLYEPQVGGNIRIGRKRGEPILVLQGHSDNGFSHVFLEFARAKLKNRRALPKDFRSGLEAGNYFSRLESFINQKPRQEMSLNERIYSVREENYLNQTWERVVQETVLRRMEEENLGFHKIQDDLIPVELQIKRIKVHKELLAEVNGALWQGHANWKKVENAFEDLRKHFLLIIEKIDAVNEVKAEWSERIKTLKLLSPGSAPELLDEDCASTKENALYFPHLNAITVCAGDFNSGDILFTLAHEMAHSLDIDHSMYLFAKRAAIGAGLRSLRQQVCKKVEFSCQEWNSLKSTFSEKLDGLKKYHPQLIEFQRCLKRTVTTKELTQPDIDRLATQIVSERIAALADEELFLRITKENISTGDGKSEFNPNYLDPCSYYLWSQDQEPLDDDLTTLMFFTAEYRCSQNRSEVEKLKSSIETAKAMSVHLMSELIGMEGEFSSRPTVVSEGFSSSPVERFADVVGTEAMAGLLNTTSSTSDRRNTFLASSSWQCSKPSFAKDYPQEYSLLRAYVNDSHADGDERKKEVFSSSIRNTLKCQKDFDFNECKLPVK